MDTENPHDRTEPQEGAVRSVERMKERRKRIVIAIAVIIFIIIISITIFIIIYILKSNPKPERLLTAGVATDSLNCSEIGRDILRSNGSAVDAAIAALICTPLFHPQSNGIGGGAIFTIQDKNGTVTIINARVSAPEKVKPNLLNECSSATGPDWIGVPGELRGYKRAHELFGRLPWSSLFEPTIQLARKGVQISSIVAQHLTSLKGLNTTLSRFYQDAEGNMLKEGDVLKYEKLADTLEKVAKLGPEVFYSGEIAQALISDVQAAGGTLSLKDLSSFEVTEPEAWSIPLDDYTMYFPPPPAGGAVTSFILNVMQGYNLSAESLRDGERVQTYHRYIEACKFANGLRNCMRDPEFTPCKKVAEIIQLGFADGIRARIDNVTHNASYYNVSPCKDSQGTTHVSVLAEDGSAVSVTSTINHIFGSRVLSPQTGVLLNNLLADFCCRTSTINPGEKPPSSTSPSILYSPSKKHTMVIGGSGGTVITTGLATALMNYLWFGKSLDDSISSPVIYVDGENNVRFEDQFDEADINALIQIGHTVNNTRKLNKAVNAVSKYEGQCVQAYSDKRKNGVAAEYCYYTTTQK